MKNQRRFILKSFGAALVFALAGCNPLSGGKRYPDYRYRLTVTVDTPEGLRSGSSVIQVETFVAGPNSIPQPNKLSTRVRGEAVTVDLGERGVLFALLRSERSVGWASGVLKSVVEPVRYEEISDEIKRTNRSPRFDIMMERTLALTGRHEIPRYYPNGAKRPGTDEPASYYPMMVRFDDLDDPMTMEKVDNQNLATSFGEGVTLKRISVERTEEPITRTIDERLKWLNNLEDYQEVKTNPFTSTLPDGIGYLRRR
ncbi:hypothetical protein [Parasphingorhabdus sp.]